MKELVIIKNKIFIILKIKLLLKNLGFVFTISFIFPDR